MIAELKNSDKIVKLENKYIVLADETDRIQLTVLEATDGLSYEGVKSIISDINCEGYINAKILNDKLVVMTKNILFTSENSVSEHQGLLFMENILRRNSADISEISIVDVEFMPKESKHMVLTTNSVTIVDTNVDEELCLSFDLESNVCSESNIVRCFDSYFVINNPVTVIIYKSQLDDEYKYFNYEGHLIKIIYNDMMYIGITKDNKLDCISDGYDNETFELNESEYKWYDIRYINGWITLFGICGDDICIATSNKYFCFKKSDWIIETFKFNINNVTFYSSHDGNLFYTSNGFCALVKGCDIKIFESLNYGNDISERFYDEKHSQHVVMVKSTGLLFFNNN